jgi:adenylate cyclase
MAQGQAQGRDTIGILIPAPAAARTVMAGKRKKSKNLALLWKDVDRWVEHPGRRLAIKQDIWKRWGTSRSVMITDLSSFSRLTRKYGIIHFLSLMRLSETLCRPVIRRFGGMLVKVIADDLIVCFRSAERAVHAAVEMQRALDRYNAKAARDFRIGMGIGIEHGSILLVEGVDLFGDPVNIASKLGEDLADPGTVLVGPEAAADYCARHPDRERNFRQKSSKVSGVDFEYYDLAWRNMP